MISAATPSTNSQGRNLTDDLYLVLTSQCLRGNQTAATGEAYQRVVAVYQHTALRKLRSWHVPNAEIEAEDAIQQWQVAMLEGALERWDLERSVYAFANQILHRICVAILDRYLRRRTLPIDTDPKCGTVDALTAMVQAEDRSRLQAATAQLPQTLRREVECWLAEGFPRELDAKARRRRSRMLWRAKVRLRQLLMESGAAGGKKS